MFGRVVWRYSLFAFLLAFMGIFMLWPIALTVRGGFVDPDGGFTLRYILGVFQDPLSIQGLVNSTLIAICTTILCLVMTLPLASLASRYDFPGKTAVSAMILLPLILPPFVGAIGLRAILGRFGALNGMLGAAGIIDPNGPGIDWLGGEVGGRFWGVVIMEALHLYPVLYLNVVAAMANLDPTLDEAAQNLGVPRWKRFWKVTFPLILPGVFAGTTIVFIWSFTELGTPLMFDFYTVTPVQIFWGLNEVAASPRPYALVVVMLAAAVGMYLIGKMAFSGKSYEMKGKASIASGAQKLTGIKGWLALVPFVVIIGLAVLPHIGLVISSFSADGAWYRSILPTEFTTEHYQNALAHPLAMGSIRNSLIYALLATVICVAVGLAISYLVVRAKVRGGWVLDSMAMLPLAVPGLVMAFGYFAMTLNWPFNWMSSTLFDNGYEGAASLLQVSGTNPNPIVILVIAYAVRRLPYVVRAASAGLEQTSGELEEAALNLGASPLTSLRRVVIPLIMANLIAGAILAFSFSMLEVSDSLILAQKEDHYPITKAIFDLFNRLGDGIYMASAMGVWGMALLTVTLAGASVLMGKKLGSVFRV